MSNNTNTLIFKEPCTNPHDYEESINQIFIKSANIQAYPCGRRRNTVVDADGNNETTGDQSLLPFDPEARLNTEANNRRHSGLNGYTQTYVAEDSDKLVLALGGYLFSIIPTADYMSNDSFDIDTFGSAISSSLGVSGDDKKIYANIVFEEAHLLSTKAIGEQGKEYFTAVLRDQIKVNDMPSRYLDMLCSQVVNDSNRTTTDLKNSDNYYFSGLSFSATPLTDSAKTRSSYSTSCIRDSIAVKQTIISLCVLEKVLAADGKTETWVVYEPARLPKIEHGDTTDSIVVTGDTLLKSKLVTEGATTLEDTLDVGGYTHLKDSLEVDKATQLNYNLTVDGATQVNDNLTVEGATQLNGGLTTEGGAHIDELTADSVKSDSIESDDINQKIGGVYYDVPVMFLEEQTEGDKTFYQLQFSRVNEKN